MAFFNFIARFCFLFPFLFVFSFFPAVHAEWQMEPVELTENFTDTAIAAGPDHHIWIAYGGSQLYTAHFDGSSWQTAIVDQSGDVGEDPSLVLDAAGRPHISYFDYSNLALKYAWFDGGTWHVETVDSSEYTGPFSSVAVDSGGHPHISYYSGAKLKYARHDGNHWRLETVDTDAPCRYTSLALDANGRPHISYSGGSDLKYAVYDGTSWNIGIVESDGETGWNSSLVLDGNGRPRIAYINYTRRELRIATFDGVSWNVETADANPSPGDDISLALDNGGASVISHRDNYYTRPAASWQSHTILYGNGFSSSLAFDSDNRPHLSWYKSWERELHHAWHDGTDWRIETVDTARPVVTEFTENGYTSLDLDATGNPHMVYSSHHPDYELRYARFAGGTWQMETAVTGADRPALALDANGRPHVSYMDTNGYDIKYAFFNGADWLIETVQSFGNVGHFSDIVVDSSGRPHISYSSGLSEGSLQYALLDGGNWQISTVVTGPTGRYNAIALDGGNHPHIGFVDDTGPGLTYAHNSGTGWQVAVIDGDAYAWSQVSIAVDGNDLPHIAYVATDPAATSERLLKHAWHTGVAWQTETVNDDERFDDPSIDIDSLGRIHISYTDDEADTDLHHAWYDGAWHFVTIDESGRVGRYPSLALDAEGRPHIGVFRYDGAWLHRFAGVWELPESPSGFSAVFTSAYNVNLSWTDNSANEDSFLIEYRDDGGELGDPGAWVVREQVGPNVTSCNVAAPPGSTAYFRVSAVNGTGATVPVLTAATSAFAPDTPAAFGADSHNITNPWFFIDNGGSWPMAGYGYLAGYNRYSADMGTEQIGGISCRKLQIRGYGNHPDPDQDPQWYMAWLARDANGDVWLFQVYSAESDETYAFDSQPILWMPANPQNGRIIRYMGLGDNCRIAATQMVLEQLENGLGPYNGVLYLDCSETDQYYVPNEGQVKEEMKNISGKSGWLMDVDFRGDINRDGQVDLADAIIGLQIAAGMAISDPSPESDVDLDGKIGLAETLFALQKISQLR